MNTLNKIAHLYNVDIEDLLSKKRLRNLVDIRCIIACELRKEGRNLEEIGDILHRDHSTITLYLKRYEILKNYNKEFQAKIEELEMNTKLLLTLDNEKLLVLNNCMVALDGMNLQSQPRALKTPVAICMELRDELLQKAIKTRQKTKSFIIKLPYYKADALWSFLQNFEIYFPDPYGTYEQNTILKIKNELHQQL